MEGVKIMTLRDISKVIYVPGTASENTIVTVKLYNDGRTVYKGKAIDLQFQKDISNGTLMLRDLLKWSILSIVPDPDFKPEHEGMPLYNYPLLITVY